MYNIKRFDSEDIFQYREDFVNLFSEIVGIENNVSRKACEEKTDEMYLYVKEKKGIVFGVLDNHELISFIWGYIRSFSNERRMHINYFVTKKEYRKKGLGGELLDTMENLAKKENLNSLDLNVDFYD